MPLRVRLERIPFLLALGHVFPLEHVVEVLVAIAHHHGPEADLADAMLVPQAKCRGLKPLLKRGQAARDTAIDAQFMNHGWPAPRLILRAGRDARAVPWPTSHSPKARRRRRARTARAKAATRPLKTRQRTPGSPRAGRAFSSSRP